MRQKNKTKENIQENAISKESPVKLQKVQSLTYRKIPNVSPPPNVSPLEYKPP